MSKCEREKENPGYLRVNEMLEGEYNSLPSSWSKRNCFCHLSDSWSLCHWLCAFLPQPQGSWLRPQAIVCHFHTCIRKVLLFYPFSFLLLVLPFSCCPIAIPSHPFLMASMTFFSSRSYWEKTQEVCLSEYGLFCLKQWSLALVLFLGTKGLLM